MDQLFEFLNKIFDSSDWPPRWLCGNWSEFHGWLYVGSDVMIWLAYFVIPIIIIWYVNQRPDTMFYPIYWLFGAFILLCGITHLLDAAMFWWPTYRLNALVRFFTAVVSLSTVFALIKDLPKALALRHPEEYTLERVKRSNEESKVLELRKEISGLTTLVVEQERTIAELRSQLSSDE